VTISAVPNKISLNCFISASIFKSFAQPTVTRFGSATNKLDPVVVKVRSPAKRAENLLKIYWENCEEGA
jgi:hypothetical protein